MIHKIESALFHLGLISDDYIMRRNLIESMDMNYKEVREHWNDENVTVHVDTSTAVMKGYADHIAERLNLTSDDVLLSVGCGDGHIDSYLKDSVGKLYGFDFADTKVKAAQRRNPECHYWVQSFLDKYQCPPLGDVNKIYSFGVAQYCQPEDLYYFIEQQVELLRNNGGGIIGHLDVPDIAKAMLYYNKDGFSEKVVKKYQSKLRAIFSDGSYWHDMDRLRLIGDRLGVIIEIKDTQCYYRSDVIIHVV